MYTFMLAIILVTVFGNLLVIMSISHFRQLQSPTNFIILSLALVDCLLGCLVLPYSMMRSVEGCWYLGETVCTLHSSLDMGLSVASLLHVCLISADRYWAICYPFRYGGNSTVLFVAFGTSITWLFSIILSFGVLFSKVNLLGVETVFLNLCVGACVLMFNKEWGIIAPIVTFFLPAAVMVSLYLKIFYVARRHAQSISDRHGVDASPQISDQKERKAAKTLSFVVGVFVLCWMPYFITTIMDPFLNFSAPTGVFDALGWFGYFNSTCNPLIYGFFYPRFQKAFKMIMSRLIFKHDFLNKTFDAA
ncbi:trace amine-associated receptor 4-like [Denticeps clupeoides]|uniref:trace amine-associated receptor 4-like n=1 Tax=Denticeps clupeoides TaxID=299321 RepID=UPI0010A36CBD|nr:trace amine-associated receptor 4-like [Denticeps clupeoides]